MPDTEDASVPGTEVTAQAVAGQLGEMISRQAQELAVVQASRAELARQLRSVTEERDRLAQREVELMAALEEASDGK